MEGLWVDGYWYIHLVIWLDYEISTWLSSCLMLIQTPIDTNG